MTITKTAKTVHIIVCNKRKSLYTFFNSKQFLVAFFKTKFYICFLIHFNFVTLYLIENKVNRQCTMQGTTYCYALLLVRRSEVSIVAHTEDI